MLTAAMYLFFIWIVIRDRGQVFLMLLLLSLAGYIALGHDGLMNDLAFYNESLRETARSYTLILAFLFSLIFTNYFLELLKPMPL